MRRILLRVAYDGAAYSGFQVQNNGTTIQGVLNDALSSWLKEDIKTIGASRTDAGVSAMGNVVAFDTETKIPGEKYAYGLNVKLPDDIKIQASYEVPLSFHPRYTDTIKTYEYKILNRKFPDPLRRSGFCFSHAELDADRMSRASKALIGEHDFASFAAVNNDAKTTVRTIYDIQVTKTDDVIKIVVCGNGFLYNMVRIIAGTLMEIGKGNLAENCIEEIIEAKDRSAAGPTAVASGLTLVQIRYPELEKLGIV